MKCENLQSNLPLYADDGLMSDERAQLDAHLDRCPVCREKLAEFQSLKINLRSFGRAEAPVDLVFALRNRIADELDREPSYVVSNSFREWLQYRVMPYGVGIVASLILTFSLLMSLLSTKEAAQKGVEYAQNASNRTLIAANSRPEFDAIDSVDPMDPSELNLPIETRRINPAGALVALTRSIVRGNMKDEEVTVVADVFGNGIAKIAEVVEAPQDDSAMKDLEKALNEVPRSAPFVSAKKDKRSNVVRVILKIQRVDVPVEVDESPRPRTRNRSL